jgi:hypothetical protein
MNAYQAKGYKNVTVWVEPDLHAALRKKLAEKGKSLRSEFIHFLEVYTGFRIPKNEATGKPDITPEV